MKTIASKFAAFAMSTITLGFMATSQANAQAAHSTAMNGRIPFPFHTSNGNMPAGQYAVIDNYQGVKGVIAFRNTETNKVVLVAGNPVDYKTSEHGSVTFRCDDGCELSAIHTADREVSFHTHQNSNGTKVAVVAVHLTGVSGE